MLITSNSSWWKKSKYRNKSANILYKYRKNGWKLKKKILVKKKKREVDTRVRHKFILYKYP